MPLHRDTPRVSVKRSHLYHREKVFVKQISYKTLQILICHVLQLRRTDPRSGAFPLLQRLCVAMCLVLRHGVRLLSIPRLRSRSHGAFKSMEVFTSEEFLEQFRFRKEHFFQILEAIKDEHGRPLAIDGVPSMLSFGRSGHTTWIRSDHAMMIMLRRLAFPCRWCDLQMLLGGSRTVLSDAYNYMTNILFDRYSNLICDVGIWRNDFVHFARHLHQLGCPHDNVVMFLDGHFQATSRPGGDGCVNFNLHDYQTFARKERLHGLKYQDFL